MILFLELQYDIPNCVPEPLTELSTLDFGDTQLPKNFNFIQHPVSIASSFSSFLALSLDFPNLKVPTLILSGANPILLIDFKIGISKW